MGGYDGPGPIGVGRLVTLTAPEPAVLIGVVAAALLYLAGVRRLRARGDAWPKGRSVAWAIGLAIVTYATMGGLAAYDTTLFSAHMAQHMLLAMVAPVPLALGGPITLALRALPGRSRSRGALVAVLHSRVAAVLAFPIVGFALFIATTFALYFTGLYEDSLRHAWLHSLVHIHFLAVGCLYFWPLLGIDPMPGRPPFWGRLLSLFLNLPFHAFLGLAIMDDKTVIGGAYYAALHRPWGASLLSDEHTGGGLLWASGDLVGLLVFATLLVQWSRADAREAVRSDRRSGHSGGDAELDAYNARLAALAAASQRPR